MFSFDTLSLLMFILTVYTAVICWILELGKSFYDSVWKYLLGAIFVFTGLAFLVSNFLVFYVCFEFIICPMFLLILVFGSRGRKLHAAYLFFFYTFASSIVLLVAIALVVIFETDMRLVMLDSDIQFICVILFFVGFAAKIPVYPLHIWLPEAHVEAPMIGSVILASLLLKLGGYGILRIVSQVQYSIIDWMSSICFVVAVISSIYAAIAAVRAIDTKKIIAYSSISHMNVSLAALFSSSVTGMAGLVYSFISHALIAGILFLYAGFFYERNHTRNLNYYGGFFTARPLFATILFLSLLANMGFPFLCHFIAELYIFMGVGMYDLTTLILLLVSFITVAIFVFGFLVRVVYGRVSNYTYFELFNFREFVSVSTVFTGVVMLGIAPFLLLDTINWTVADYEMRCDLIIWNIKGLLVTSNFISYVIQGIFIIFAIALLGFTAINPNIIYMLICVEILFMSLNMSYIVIGILLNDITSQVIYFYILVVSACEVAVFLTVIMIAYFKYGSIQIDILKDLKWA